MLHVIRAEPHYNNTCSHPECSEAAEFNIEITICHDNFLSLCPKHFYTVMKEFTAEGLAFAEEDDAPTGTTNVDTDTTTIRTGNTNIEIIADPEITRSLLEGLAYQLISNVTDPRRASTGTFARFATIPAFLDALVAVADGTDIDAPREVCIAYMAKRLANDPTTIAKMVDIASK